MGNAADRRLAVSVDLDEWYHARWVTGAAISRWPQPKDFFRAVYGGDGPRGDIVRPTEAILDIFDAAGVRATFFILGEVAGFYPDLVRRIAARGHEIACHGMRHVDLWEYTPESFAAEVGEAKARLEDLAGTAVRGFRAPNLVIEPWMLPVLAGLGFSYDSSVCPSRKLMGKFGSFQHCPMNPYRLGPESFTPGRGGLAEIPIPVFPVLRLPAATGIMTRVAGRWWTEIALRHALRTGDALYYFHPYEMTPNPGIPLHSFRERLFCRRAGAWMEDAVRTLLSRLSHVPRATCAELAGRVGKVA